MQPPSPGPNDPDAETRRVSDSGPGSYQPDPDAETRRVGDGGPGSYQRDPNAPPGQPSRTPPESYPPTVAYPQSGGYPQAGGYPQGGSYPPSSNYPPGSYPAGSQPQGGYPPEGARGYGQGGYDQGGGYGQSGYGGYPQGGYPGYPQGGYGGYPPPDTGAGRQSPNRNRRRNLIIIAAAAVLLVVGIPLAVVLATSGGDEPEPEPNANVVVPTAPPTTPSTTPGTPSPASSPTPTSTGAFTAGQLALLGKLDQDAMVDCEPNEEGEGGAVDSSVLCATNDGYYVIAYDFVDGDALTTDTRNRSSTVTSDGACEDGKSGSQDWNYDNNGDAQGTLLCYFSDDGDFVIYWTYDDRLLSFLVLDSDPTALYQWWRKFEPIQR